MIDADVAYLSPSTVYRLLQDADLLARWKRSTHAGTAPPKPTRPHERWPTDLRYRWIADSGYFLVTVIDGLQSRCGALGAPRVDDGRGRPARHADGPWSRPGSRRRS